MTKFGTPDMLGGKRKIFNIERSEKLPFGDFKSDFGALLDAPIEIDGRPFQVQGWFGPSGKSMPVVAEILDEPGKSADGTQDLPAIRVYGEVNGELTELAVAWRKQSTSGKTFFGGQFSLKPHFALTLWPHTPRVESSEPQAEMAGAQG